MALSPSSARNWFSSSSEPFWTIVTPVHREKSATEASKRSASTPVKDVATVTVVPAGKEPYCSASSAQVAVGPAWLPPPSGAQAGRPATPVHRAVTSARRRNRRRTLMRIAPSR